MRRCALATLAVALVNTGCTSQPDGAPCSTDADCPSAFAACDDAATCTGTRHVWRCPTTGSAAFHCSESTAADASGCQGKKCSDARCSGATITTAGVCDGDYSGGDFAGPIHCVQQTMSCPASSACSGPTSCAVDCDTPFDAGHTWSACTAAPARTITTDADGVLSVALPGRANVIALDRDAALVAYMDGYDLRVLDLATGAERVVTVVPDASTARDLYDIRGLSLEGRTLTAVPQFSCTNRLSACPAARIYEAPLLIDLDACTASLGAVAETRTAECASPPATHAETVLAASAHIVAIGEYEQGYRTRYRLYQQPGGSLLATGPDTSGTAVARGDRVYMISPTSSLVVATVAAPTPTTLIASLPANVGGLDASDSTVVWSDGRVHALDLTTLQVVDVPSPSGASVTPKTLGSLVARGEVVASGEVDVYVYDLATGTDVAVATTAASQRVLGVTPLGVCWVVDSSAASTVFCDTRYRP